MCDDLKNSSPWQLRDQLTQVFGEHRVRVLLDKSTPIEDRREAAERGLQILKNFVMLAESDLADLDKPDTSEPINYYPDLRKALFATLSDLGYPTNDYYRDERLALLSSFTDDRREIGSVNELTVGEAQRAIDALKNIYQTRQH